MYSFKPRLQITAVMTLALIASILGSPASPPATAQEGTRSIAKALSKSIPNQPEASGLLTIPYSQSAPTIDGACDAQEYGGAAVQTFPDGNGSDSQVYLINDGKYLYVCMVAQPGTLASRFGSLYLDPQGDGSAYTYAEKNDHAFHVQLSDGATSSYSGTGVANGYMLDPSLDLFWNGDASTAGGMDTVEYRLEVGRLQFGQDCRIFGLAMYHHWFAFTGDDYGWPSNQYFDQPRTWQLARLGSPACLARNGQIAYVFRGDTLDAVTYYNLLSSAGYAVTLVPLSDVLSTNFANFNLILIANDTGYLDNWGITSMTAAQVAQITAPNKPIIGLGEGGYAFFGKLAIFIGWPNGWHGPQKNMYKAATAPAAYFNTIASDPVQVYANPVNSVGIYLNNGPLPGDVIPVGLEDPNKDHASLIMAGCRLLWGGSGNPLAMTTDGRTVTLNAVGYMIQFQCPPAQPPPPDTCIDIVKTANPPAGTPVTPGQVIEYTITYTLSNNPDCLNPKETRLVDSVPLNTTFVPGSASDGISPGADGALVWAITPSASAQSKTFKIFVPDSLCSGSRQVANRAGILLPGLPPVISNVVTHPVDCPPVGFPNTGPVYAETEIHIIPYPPAGGDGTIESTIEARISNYSSVPQPVMVSFQTSPNLFGIGLDFVPFETKSVVIPANSSVIVQGHFTPSVPGHFCIQVVVSGPGLPDRLVTQRNIDVTEELQAGVADTLTFKVRNNTSTAGDVILVVDNTCPGWDAQITSPAGGVLAGMAPGEVRQATLQVIPPDPVVLGSGCHIDVQGWINDHLIGGIRKIDVPPVHLPTDVQPPWEEPEISFNPDPPVAGHPTQFCVLLTNPLPITRTVTIEYAVADFGAGVPFTTVDTKTFSLPPNSVDKYCTTWTPVTSGTLHRCALVTLKQEGYRDMRSQRNIDIVRTTAGRLGSLDIPFKIHNPDLVGHTLTFTPTLIGIDPYWQPQIVTDPGDPPPAFLNAGQTVNLHLMLLPAVQRQVSAAPQTFAYGDVSQVQVAVLFDGQITSGFTVQLDSKTLYLPLIER